jgi:hypothetical protein
VEEIAVSPRSILLLFVIGATLRSQAAELKVQSATAWNDFVTAKQIQLKECDANYSPGGHLDLAAEVRTRLRTGEIIVRPAGKNGITPVPGALIHDWIGMIFVPGASLDNLLASVRDYDRYPRMYQPSVVSGKLRVRHPDFDLYTLIIRQNVLTMKAGLDGDYRSDYHRLDDSHGYSITQSGRLQEISGFGSEDQKEFAPGTGAGFIWRIYSSAKYEAADGGVYLEFEATALSRPIPRGLSWLVNPIVERTSRSALITTLRQTRDAQDGNESLSSGLNERERELPSKPGAAKIRSSGLR